ncbi:MAG: prepilin peptidase [Acidobacteriota bacterium]
MSPHDWIEVRSDLFVYGALWAVVFGAAIGSFLNVVAHRLPQRRSVVAPRSRCPRCRLPIRPWHNLPVVGWLLLRGRCRDCRGAISWRYPAVELATGLLFAACWWRYGLSVSLPVAWLWTTLLVVLALVDLDARILPYELTVPAAALALLVPGLSWATPRSALAGLCLGVGLALVASSAWRLVHGVDGLADGDVAFLGALGVAFGWRGLLIVLAGACALGLGVAGWQWLVGGIRRRPRRAEALPFGTFLGIAGLALLVLDPRIVSMGSL